jgi:hypothetical protein
MSYEKKWKILADFLIELQKKGKKTPIEIMNDLRSAKTIIQVLKADPTHTESISRIDTYLRNVESYAIFAAENLGIINVEEWLKKIKDPKKLKHKEKLKTDSRLILGIPRDKSWVRIRLSEEPPVEIIEELVKASELSYKIQENGQMIVYGNKENIKSFIKRMTEQFISLKKDNDNV